MDRTFKKGDLVAACYDFEDYYIFYNDPKKSAPHYGIIVGVRWHGDFYGYGPAYEILCMDRTVRIFYRSEITLL